VVAGDAFCEACGHDLAAPAAAGADASPVAAGETSTELPPPRITTPDTVPMDDDDATEEHPRTHLLTPARADDGMGVDTSLPCLACGAEVADDGFCSVCGHKARTRRDHWTETHGDRVGAVCDKGIEHARNEDAMATGVGASGVIAIVVCDGVTTAPESDRASLAASLAAREVLLAGPAAEGSPAQRLSAWEPVLVASCRVANAEAVAVARALGDPPEPPSCTFVAAVVDDDLIATAWCGDSRAYFLADPAGGVAGEQLSIDHSLGTEMIRRGMTREQAEADPTSHTITRWLGADSLDPTPEFRAMQVTAPGWLLVCSDGLWNYASGADELGALVARAQADGATSPTAIAESMAAWANQQGGHDNITVALVRCEPPLP
jgi:serine/threonine protein phosphatase PrpC